MFYQNRQYWWLAGALALIIVLFTGAVIGGVVGYVAASNWGAPMAGPQQETLVGPAVSQVNAVLPTTTEPQSLVITEESASVTAVEQVLPAVVTVLVQSGFGAGSGSGFFMSEDGYVVTNNHVVEGARDIRIIYAKGGTAPARLIGTAPEFDLAVLQVEGPVPGVAAWGDSRHLPLGANVIAIGSALGQYQNSVTQGVLSGFNRQLAGMSGLLQTDAAINQGNSGGPLINLAGQVIGINTLVARGRGDVEGLGFAIPSNIARNVVQNLIETGNARHPFMGIQYASLNPQLATEAQLDITEGALLEVVMAGSPADRASLQVGDVIVAINGEPVNDRQPLVSLLLEHVAGETITLDVIRDDQQFQTQLTLGERA
jgi:2-alkenal reductase